MKAGTSIQGYRLLSDGTTANSGRSLWAFAAKGGEEFFIKQFLSPKYPVAGAPGSEANKAKQRTKCADFEGRQRRIIDALKKSVGRGGNLIFPFDFFREGALYYKVSEKVETSALDVDGIRGLSTDEKLLLLVTIAHSVRILHDAKIVHGDLKPPNILIKRTNKKKYVAKVIDFDDSYFEGPIELPPDEIVGDPAYYSPELWGIISGKSDPKATLISTKSDVFALGIIFCQYWCGHFPDFDRAKLKYLCNGVSEKGELASTGRSLPAPLEALILKMLSADPEERPSVRDVFNELKSLKAADIEASMRVRGSDGRTSIGGLFSGVLTSHRKVEDAVSPPPAATSAAASPADRSGTRSELKRTPSAGVGLKGTLLTKSGSSIPVTGGLRGRALKPKK